MIDQLKFSEEVRRALDAKAPLVALETSVVAQGLPYPDNLAAARACEEAVRRAGAVPAPIAVVDGQVWIGLEDSALRRLAEGKEKLMKLGSRDLAVAMALKASGGTTVSATCELAAAAGIRVFATGGLGGVHRGASEHWDVSQDI
ncbi:MAG TPA: pseudouridine-5'-phosphate glycosidase, partial [Myxococcaceae bacterium]